MSNPKGNEILFEKVFQKISEVLNVNAFVGGKEIHSYSDLKPLIECIEEYISKELKVVRGSEEALDLEGEIKP